jgi:hypothetical protein
LRRAATVDGVLAGVGVLTGVVGAVLALDALVVGSLADVDDADDDASAEALAGWARAASDAWGSAAAEPLLAPATSVKVPITARMPRLRMTRFHVCLEFFDNIRTWIANCMRTTPCSGAPQPFGYYAA